MDSLKIIGIAIVIFLVIYWQLRKHTKKQIARMQIAFFLKTVLTITESAKSDPQRENLEDESLPDWITQGLTSDKMLSDLHSLFDNIEYFPKKSLGWYVEDQKDNAFLLDMLLLIRDLYERHILGEMWENITEDHSDSIAEIAYDHFGPIVG